MKKLIFLTISIFVLGLSLPTSSFAQGMMGFPSSSPDNAASQSQQQEEQEGKKLLDDVTNKTVACSQLKDADFEKIGEYFMGQSIGDTSRHIAMNEMMKRMMGDKGEEQMHIVWGKQGSKCDTTAQFISATRVGGFSMMGYGGMMNAFGGMGSSFSFLGLIIWLLIIVNLVLLAVYLWKKIQKNKVWIK